MPSAQDLEPLWETHSRQWRDPALAINPWQGGSIEPRLLQMHTRGDWWQTLERLDVSLLVTREYEHLLMAIGTVGERPRVSYLPLPHPSGLAVDRKTATVSVASTRNPNQIYELRPVGAESAAANSEQPDGERWLMPVRSTIHPGALYMHDVAHIGGKLHANAVGQNAVVEIFDDGRHERVWWPKAIERNGMADFSRNWIQLNSIAAGEDLAGSYFSASSDRMSARRPGHLNFPVDGRGVIFSGATREPIARGLTRPHSARLHGGRLWVDNSGYGELTLVRDGRPEVACRLPGWTRGLCFCGDVAFVGTSRVIPRFRRYAPGLDVERSVCGLHAVAFDSGRILGSLIWPYGNQIFAIDWLPRHQSAELPFQGSVKASADRAAHLFYSLR